MVESHGRVTETETMKCILFVFLDIRPYVST